jgi:hypothetical protein
MVRGSITIEFGYKPSHYFLCANPYCTYGKLDQFDDFGKAISIGWIFDIAYINDEEHKAYCPNCKPIYLKECWTKVVGKKI